MGPDVAYKAGQAAFFSLEKARLAQAAGWVEIIESDTPVSPKVTPPVAAKAAPAVITDVEVILARFGNDASKIRAYADEQGVNVGRAKSAEALAKAIARHNENK